MVGEKVQECREGFRSCIKINCSSKHVHVYDSQNLTTVPLDYFTTNSDEKMKLQ